MLPTVLDASRALKSPGQHFPFEASGIDIEELEVLDDPVKFTDVRLEGEMLATEDSVTLTGRLTAEAVTRCVRCLDRVVLPMETEFREVFLREVKDDDPDSYPFTGSGVELNEAAKNALLLELPYRILCSESCKGLCPRCGKNLNEGPCTCQEGDEVMNPFSALKAIVKDEEEV